MNFRFSRKHLSIPYAVFLFCFVVAPLIVVVYYAFTNGQGRFTMQNFVNFFTSPNTIGTLCYSLAVAVAVTICCTLIAYPTAYILAKSHLKRRGVLLVLFIAPMWINFTLRVVALKEVLTVIEGNLAYHPFLNTVIGMTYDFLPFMILPLYTTLSKLDNFYLEAAADLGANPATTFLKVTLPLSLPGFVSGVTMVFLPSMTNYVILDMLYNSTYIMGSLIGSYFNAYDWHNGSMISLVLLLIIFILTWATNGFGEEETSRGQSYEKNVFRYAWLFLVLLFMYLPVLLLMGYSFTDTAVIGTSGNFSLKNYVTLFTTEELLKMIGGTFALAFGSAFLATILGTIGAIGAFYCKKGPKHTINMLNQIPVVNAEVVTGFSLCVLLIVVCGVNKESFVPLVIGHIVLEAPFVYLSVLPKLKQMDNSIYEAALDLGANARTALAKVVIPQLIPGIVSGFMLSVTLSLDDYFITTYTKPATFDTISTYVVNATKGSHTEIKTALWALSTVIFVVVLTVVLVENAVSARKAGAANEK